MTVFGSSTFPTTLGSSGSSSGGTGGAGSSVFGQMVFGQALFGSTGTPSTTSSLSPWSGVLAVGRRLALDLMVDACTIVRTTGALTQDETTGRITPTVTELYGGRCQVRAPALVAETPEVGARTATVQRLIIKVPVEVVDVRIGDRVVVTDAVHDPELVGREFVVSGLHHKTFSTARKLAVDEITA